MNVSRQTVAEVCVTPCNMLIRLLDNRIHVAKQLLQIPQSLTLECQLMSQSVHVLDMTTKLTAPVSGKPSVRKRIRQLQSLHHPASIA